MAVRRFSSSSTGEFSAGFVVLMDDAVIVELWRSAAGVIEGLGCAEGALGDGFLLLPCDGTSVLGEVPG